VLVATAAAVVGLRRRRGLTMLQRWPHAVGLLIGLAWWWWLHPSVVGLAIAGGNVAWGLRSIWLRRRKKSRPTGR
jgi:hypothetical protein